MLIGEMVFQTILTNLELSLGMPGVGPIVNDAIGALIFGIVVLIGVTIFDYLFGWMERKLIARMQLRHGPTVVGKYGLLQNLADFVKLFAKENIIPTNANRWLFLLSLPLMAAIFTFIVEILPYGPAAWGVNLTLGLLLVFVLLSFVPLLVFMISWASGNKFASISAQRSVMMLISYEIPLFIVVASVALLAHSLSLTEIVSAQSGWWYIVLMPVGFVIFLIAMLAELERPPFDLREADSELIAGWLTDVGAPLYAISLFVDYTRMFVGAALISILFLGGWNGPILPPEIWLLIKIIAVSVIVVVIRATVPRMRLDRILRLGWFWLIPLSIANLAWGLLLVSGVL